MSPKNTVVSSILEISRSLVNLLFPPLCRLCNEPTPNLLCSTCVSLITPPYPTPSSTQIASLIEPSPLAPRLEGVLENDIELQEVIASYLLIQWHRLEWPVPDRVVYLPTAIHQNALKMIASRFSRLLDSPRQPLFQLQWNFKKLMQSNMNVFFTNGINKNIRNKLVLCIAWKHEEDVVKKEIEELKKANPKSVYLLNIFENR